jgi:hypothetical protein
MRVSTVHRPAGLRAVTAMAMLGMTASFGWVLALDLRTYGELPDDILAFIQALLIVATGVALTRWRWAPGIVAAVAASATIGSAVQPITALRLSEPESAAFAAGTVLLLTFGALATMAASAETVRVIRWGRRRKARRDTAAQTGSRAERRRSFR